MPSFSADVWKAMGEGIKEEKERRANSRKRMNLEGMWKEIDRQLEMLPKERKVSTGQDSDWMPNTELSLQANAYEVILADARRMIFPRTKEWYAANTYLSDEYLQRFEQRRGTSPLVGDVPLPAKVDQETADALTKAAMDHFHGMYDFRGAIELFLGEQVKYGTAIATVKPSVFPRFTSGTRGIVSSSVRGPAVVTRSIKNVYLDDTPSSVMREGFVTNGAIVERAFMSLESLKDAAKRGGNDRGWRVKTLDTLEPMRGRDEKQGHVELLRWEGDLTVTRSRENIFLPNVAVTVAVGGNGARVVRFQENQDTTQIAGHYLRESVGDPYGVSPLMKGQPLQEAASEALNRMMAAAALSAQPAVLYDRFDMSLAASGGLEIAPGAEIGVENIDNFRPLEIGNLGELLNVYLGLLKQYEDVTGVNDPRRGAQTKSHTTAFAADIEQARGQVRTESFIERQQGGPLAEMLSREFHIIKKVMTSERPVNVNTAGIQGWVRIGGADLPDQVGFDVHGALGPLEEREQTEALLNATRLSIELIGAAAQLGLPAPQLNMEEIIRLIYQRAGWQDVDRFIAGASGVQGAAPNLAAVPGAGQGVPPAGLEALAG